ncbi:MAG: sigma-54 dependent transcriptional regulator [Desulfomonilaceae bacterium]|nr:sigma-54 dependent transcriptional regulator [Desulfomonilaceae bacterium]
MNEVSRVLAVDDEEEALDDLEHVLRKEKYDVVTAHTGPEALELIRNNDFDVVLTDLRMEKVDGMTILREAKEKNDVTEVIMITAFASVDTAIEAMRRGAYHYLAKPYRVGEVRKVVAEAAEKVRLKKEISELKKDLEDLQEGSQVKIVTQNAGMRSMLDTALKAALADCNVLITGESGTGKDLLARFIHENSRRRKGPFMAINCGVFNEELLANELFGHEKGAYTGAVSSKAGIIECAAGGSLFLDEVTEMSPNMQVKLLRVIQERQLMRVGGTSSLEVDVRFIAATNRNIEEAITEGRFRQDLYYRLNVVSLEIPALRERKDDILLLCQFFLMKHAKLMQRKPASLSREVREILRNHDFPGNVRELENIIERGLVLSTGNSIEVRHLPGQLLYGHSAPPDGNRDDLPTLEETEIQLIKRVLDETGGNKKLASSILGIDRSSLWRKIKKYGLEEHEAG